jgi:outer membrane cobalamin receptor
MFKNYLSIIAVLALSFANSLAQKITISGYVSDITNGERLIGAIIFSVNNNKYCITNEQGFYSLTMGENETVSLQASYVGYDHLVTTFKLKADTVVNFLLSSTTTLNEVVVTSNISRLSPNIQKISIHQIEKLPVLVGEPDVIKTIQLLPGVQSGAEGHTGLYVKGGEDDQNLILLDGVPVYNPNHLFGFFSIFNERAIQDITVYKGNFPSKYGGRLSSVVDIQTKEGNGKKIEGSASIGALATTMNLEGPLFGNKTTFFISGRISYLELIGTPIVKHFTNYNSAGYRFYDYNGKITHRFNNKHKLIFSYYRSYDYGYTNEMRQETALSQASNYQWEETTEWGNHIFSLAWNYAITPSLFMNTLANYSIYGYLYKTKNQYGYGTQSDMLSNESSSSIKDKGLQSNLTWYNSPKSTLRAGIGYNLLTFVPGVDIIRLTNIEILDQFGNPINVNIDTTLGHNKYQPIEFAAYIENEIKFGELITFTPGLRYVYYNNHCSFQEFEPRLNLNLRMGKADFNGSYTESNQFDHLLETSKVSQSTDLWIPTTKNIKPEKSRQISLSMEYMLSKGIEFSAEVYFKQLSNLVEYQEGASYYTTAISWEDMVTFGTGKSYGIIFNFEKKYGNTTGWISYTLSKSLRKFAELNNGEEFPFAYSRPHDFKIILTHKFSERFDASCTWVYHSGNNLTFSNVKYFGYYLYLKKNSYRLPDYHRLDININYNFRSKHLEQNISLGAYNVYNHKNIYSLEYYYSGIDKRYYIRERPLFPIIPSLTYRIKF